MTQFANLPDDCYQLIFDLFPTSSLLTLRRVSHAWKRNQQIACLRRKTLILLMSSLKLSDKMFAESFFESAFISHGIDHNGKPFNFDKYRVRNQLTLGKFNHKAIQFLASTFPNVDTLLTTISSKAASIALIELLQLYSSQMVTLKVYFRLRFERLRPGQTKSSIVPVIRQLNSMTALERVTLEYQRGDGRLEINESDDLEFLSRLKEFNCYSFVLSRFWYNELHRLEKCNISQLKQIALCQGQWVLSSGLHQRNEHEHCPFSACFTHFPYSTNVVSYFDNAVDNSPHFQKTIGHFHSLKSFIICHNGSSSLSDKINILSEHNTALVHILIWVRVPSLFVPFDPSTIKPLESVKALDLNINFDRKPINLKAQISPLVHTFPNLESIKIFNYGPNLLDRSQVCSQFFNNLKEAFGKDSLRTEYS